VERNGIVDSTDVGIVVFEANTATQQTQVRNNYVVAAGNSAFGALLFDALLFQGSYSFAGAAIDSNHFWTGKSTHFDAGLSAGTRHWFGPSSGTGYGGAITNNTTGGVPTRVNTGVFVNGMHNVTVTGNTNQYTIVPTNACPTGHVVAALSANYASGTIQQHDVDATGSQCINTNHI
jgi:hypothetical protein